jgi:hypothetical protein
VQARLRRDGLDEVAAVKAARWLDDAGLLTDSASRPGLPLRKLLRAGLIRGAEQRPRKAFGRWYITIDDEARSRTKPRAHRRRVRTPKPASGRNDSAEARARRRRERAARKYRPADVELLLVAEAPPSALDRYFYFEDVRVQDSLFRYVARGILGVEPTRKNKGELLKRLRDRGVFLIDLRPNPVDGKSRASEIPQLVRRARDLNPKKIIVIKTGVYDLVYKPLVEAGLPVVDEDPIPGQWPAAPIQ